MGEKSLGELGNSKREVVDLVFTFFGEKIRVHPEAGELSYADFMSKALEIDEEDAEQGLPLTMSYLREQIHPDDWDTFYATAKKHRQTVEDLMKVSNAILEEVSGFPTEQPTGSSPTPSKTVRKSRAGSSTRDKRSVVDAAMEILEGRPDLQVAVEHAQAARSAN